MPFEFSDTDLRGVKIIKPTVFGDERGQFMEVYKREAFNEAGIEEEFVQDNCSKSEANVLRGLHYQRGDAAQTKLVQCSGGAILDTVVDLKYDSDTFGHSKSVILSEHNNRMLYVPRDYAHGFLTLTDNATVRYKVDSKYSPEDEAGIIWDDPTLEIDWPVDDPKLSDKDTTWPTLEAAVERDLVF
ncbi:dTDP-4-dehydrorhamnose 3,5-epimerase [Halorubrum sp. Ea8]|uniref:dTDP-4-dehydrorhamnose 3,5-epimerase n=1 Tax=Halorubrum sp. Ea8 TaxID=1383841 RepID=UPI000B98B4EF|nr:dTDP-4-dehydrorhamnose 3,5-epimerase [Halorubrum sp. Ea8]OYR44612.1 dTDP-4-dehydrorhamnose 3,5-epimerase [Halorubrum sp. Ea8]